MAEVLLDAEGDLLHVGGVVVEVGGEAGGQDGEGEAGGDEVLIDEDGGGVVGVEALLRGEVVEAGEGRQLALASEPWKVLVAFRLVGWTVLAAVQGEPPARMTRGTV